ncbi:sugar transporter [Verticillium alfalfae VaMs.102]|uniref:Sugar transporter n=1 Tax=Verticillium alfalfae (strain VaMs.102 / ATCC MYA-4576 / FGSC 10136) TaxID=526221 RepID=C9SLH7_VERA1|nr:sugar transporter [Verticillium alfalfae VaMs.102]EEY19545.1 sugar transporter [Verticillium alfalfae VaMs.102]
MAPRNEVERSHVYHDAVADANKTGVQVVDVVATRITEDHLNDKSREAFPGGPRLVSACYGIDWGVISSINSNDMWHEYYGFGNSGHIIGVINALMTIGATVGAPFLSFADKWGRRSVNFAGCALTVIAAIIQAMAPNTGVLIFGRFVLGFGTALCTSSQYIAEVAPPHMRGRIVGVFGACFQVGSMAIIGIMAAISDWHSNWQWRTAFFIQALFPAFVCCTIFFLCPESPRYLMDESIETSAVGFRAVWDFRVFFTKALDQHPADAAPHQPRHGGTYFVFTLFGAYIIDIFRRRTLIFAGLISIVIAQTCVTITSWQFEEQDHPRHLAYLVLFWMFSFQVCSASFIATMHNLYPVELLSLPLRAKGMGLYVLFQNCASTVHNYGIAVGIDKLKYKIWAVYIVYNTLQIIAAYFWFPETSKLNLEEIDHIFETPGANPVKLSVKIADAKHAQYKLDRQAEQPVAYSSGVQV